MREMYIFFSKPMYFKGAPVSSRFIQAKFKLENSLNIATEFYNSNSSYLNNSHILIRLCAGFSFDPTESEESIYGQIMAYSNRIASGVGITTDINPGVIFKKAFYTHYTAIVNMSFSDMGNIPHWKRIRAVRVLTHPHVTLDLVLPNRLKSLEETDYAVVGIDIPLLAVQFRGWVLEESKKPVSERENISQFITKWVLPGMLPEQIDICLRNRIQYLCNGIKREEPEIKAPIFIQGYDNEFDIAFKALIKYYSKKKVSLSEIMLGLPMFSKDNYYEAAPKNLDSLSLMSFWTRLMIYTDWLYPLAIGFNIDPIQENVSVKMRKTLRYLEGSNPDKLIDEPIKSFWSDKFNLLVERWKQT